METNNEAVNSTENIVEKNLKETIKLLKENNFSSKDEEVKYLKNTVLSEINKGSMLGETYKGNSEINKALSNNKDAISKEVQKEIDGIDSDSEINKQIISLNGKKEVINEELGDINKDGNIEGAEELGINNSINSSRKNELENNLQRINIAINNIPNEVQKKVVERTNNLTKQIDYINSI